MIMYGRGRVTRYRRDVIAHLRVCEYTAETWVSIDGGRGLQFVSQGDRYRFPLQGWELEAAKAGWTEPDAFTYHDSLPEKGS